MTGVVEEGQKLSAQTYGETEWENTGVAAIIDQKIMTVVQSCCNVS